MNAQRILASGAAALLVLIVLAIVHARRRRSERPDDDAAAGRARDVARPRRRRATSRSTAPCARPTRRARSRTPRHERFGKDNVVSNLEVRPPRDSADWLAKVMPSLPRKGSGYGPIDIAVTKARITVSGSVPTAAAGSGC